MQSRISLPELVLLVGLSLALTGAACGQYSISNIRALKAFKDANDALQEERVQGGRRRLPGGARPEPGFLRHHLLLPGQQLRQPVQARTGRRAGKRRLPAEGRRELQARDREDQGHRPAGSADPQARVRVPDRRLRHRQAARLREGRAGGQAADPDGAERAAELPGARQALRGFGPVRRGRGPVPEGRRGQAERPHDLHGPRRLLQPPGPVRQDDGRASRSAPQPSRTTPRPGTRSRPTTPTSSSATSGWPRTR